MDERSVCKVKYQQCEEPSIFAHCNSTALSAINYLKNEKEKNKTKPKQSPQKTTLSPQSKPHHLHCYSILCLKGRRHIRSFKLFSSRQCGFALYYIFPCNLCGLNLNCSSDEDYISFFGTVAGLGLC